MNATRSQHHGVWFISILLLVGSVLLFVGGPDHDSPRSLKYFWDLGHIVYFALLASLLMRWQAFTEIPLIWQWVTILTGTLLIGTAIELMQYGTSRTPNIGDIVRDLNGSLLVLVFGPPGQRLRQVGLRQLLRISVLILTLFMLWPLVRSLIDETIARHQHPLLSSFETPFETGRWEAKHRLSVESITPESDGKSLKLSLTTDKYSGAALKYFDGDWTSARTLRVRLHNPDTSPLQITCRIHDLQHSNGSQEFEDRYNRSFNLVPGWNQLEIDLEEVQQSPSGRLMDMSRIRGLMFFAVALPSPRVIYIDDVLLTY